MDNDHDKKDDTGFETPQQPAQDQFSENAQPEGAPVPSDIPEPSFAEPEPAPAPEAAPQGEVPEPSFDPPQPPPAGEVPEPSFEEPQAAQPAPDTPPEATDAPPAEAAAAAPAAEAPAAAPAGESANVAQDEIVSLTKLAPGIRTLKVCLGWDAPSESNGFDVDMDACAFLIGRQGKVRMDEDFVFYNNLALDDGSVTHSGDNEDGKGDGDDEIISVDLEKLSFEVDRLAFTVSIHNADEREQSFSIVQSAFVRIVNQDNLQEIIRFNMDCAKLADQYAAIVCEVFRDETGSGWSFAAKMEPHEKGLFGIARDYGVNVAEP